MDTIKVVLMMSYNYLKCIFHGASNLVVFAGPSGSGKTTLSPLLERELPNMVVWYPMNRVLYPTETSIDNTKFPLGRFSLFNHRVKGKMGLHPRNSPSGSLVWVIFFHLEFLELHLRLAKILYKHKGDGKIIIVDQYPWDWAISYGKKWLELHFIKFLAKTFPRPGCVVLCKGDPQQIFERKQILFHPTRRMTPVLIAHEIEQYRVYFTNRGIHTFEINTTTENVAVCLKDIKKILASHYNL
jgi:thymidylate kinase